MKVQRRPFEELGSVVHKVLAQPHTLDELAAILTGATPGDNPLDVLDQLLMFDRRMAWHPGEVFFRHDMIFADLTVTHRVTDEELAAGRLGDSAAVAAVAELLEVDNEGDSIADGPSLRMIHEDGVDDDGEPVHRHFYRVDEGWMAGCEAGRLCGFKVTSPSSEDESQANDEHRCSIEFLPIVEEPTDEAVAAFGDALSLALTALNPSGQRHLDSGTVLTQVLLDHPGTWDELPPLEEAAASEGIELRGVLLAPAGYDWDRAEAEAPIQSAASYFRLEPPSQRHLRDAVETFRRWRASDASDRGAITAQAPRTLLPDTFLAEAFGAAIVNYEAGPTTEERAAAHADVDSFASSMVERARGSEALPYLWLQSVSAAAIGNGETQLALLEQAHALSPNDPVVCEDLGYCRVDQSRYLDAYTLLEQAGARGGIMSLVSDLTWFARVDVGRNEPCPCGSDQKFKKCHGAGGNQAEASAADAASALYQKPTRLLRAGLDLPQWMYWPGEWSHDPATSDGLDATDWKAGLDTLDDLGVLVDILLAEAGGMTQFVERRRALLPADEAGVAERWASVERGVFKAAEADAEGGRLVLENLLDGSIVDCSGDHGVQLLEVGAVVVARPLPIGGGLHRLFGGVVSVAEAQLDQALALFTNDEFTNDESDRSEAAKAASTAERVARGLVHLLHTAHKQAADPVLCFAVVEPLEPARLAEWENSKVRFDRSPGNELKVGAVGDGTIVVKNEGRLTLVTYSTEDHAALLASLDDALGKHEVATEHAVTASVLQQEVMMLRRDLLDGPAAPAADPKGEFDSAVLTRILETAMVLNLRAEADE